MLTGKKIVLGVSGGIAAYKMANVASMLSKLHADIHVVMTENATHFITPETFEVLTGNHCYTDTFVSLEILFSSSTNTTFGLCVCTSSGVISA